jgi:hypothetical protein
VRYTGIAIAIIGVAIAVFSGIISLIYGAPSADLPALQAEQQAGPNLTMPLGIAAVAVVVGIALYLFGGRGYAVTRAPGTQTPPIQG